MLLYTLWLSCGSDLLLTKFCIGTLPFSTCWSAPGTILNKVLSLTGHLRKGWATWSCSRCPSVWTCQRQPLDTALQSVYYQEEVSMSRITHAHSVLCCIELQEVQWWFSWMVTALPALNMALASGFWGFLMEEGITTTAMYLMCLSQICGCEFNSWSEFRIFSPQT